jgi:XTP/dITP diphosphohydrolase
MDRIALGSTNASKVRELQQLLGASIQVVPLSELGVSGELKEDADTLEENALQKARFGSAISGLPCLADDSGLEVAALNGRPGVRSARYAGSDRNDRANMDRLLSELSGVDDRSARFRTVLAFVDHDTEMLFEGCVEGRISAVCRGTGGFGYDPVFIPEGDTRTFAEMAASEKNALSHRARAIALFLRHVADRS